LVSEPDKGLYDAMNKAQGHSSGDYIVYLNAGDVLKNANTLERAMANSNDADLVYGLAIKIDEKGNEFPWHKRTPEPSKLTAKSFINGMVICHQCMIVKKNCVVKYDLTIGIAADIDWSIRTMKNVKTKHFYDDTFCLFLKGGVSDEKRWTAIKERFRISVKHFGWTATLFQQFGIIFNIIKRGKLD